LLAEKNVLELPKDPLQLLLMPPTTQPLSYHFFVVVTFTDPSRMQS
jgi:hypothetical protein